MQSTPAAQDRQAHTVNASKAANLTVGPIISKAPRECMAIYPVQAPHPLNMQRSPAVAALLWEEMQLLWEEMQHLVRLLMPPLDAL